MPPSRTAATCGRWAWASPKRWTRRSAAWGSTGPRRSSSSAVRSTRRATCRARSSRAVSGTDHLAPDDARGVDDVIAAYEQQMEAVEALGGRMIVMASRALARIARSPADYERVYDRILSQAREPVILHWLGEMFDPALAGYWGDARSHARDGHGARRHRGPRFQGRRHQDLAPRRGQGNRDAPPPAARRAHVLRRRLQLRRADRRRCARPQRRAARHLRRHRAGRLRGARRARRRQYARSSTTSSRRPCRCRATSSRRRRASTRQASCSSRGSTATSRTSRWWAASRARAASLHLAELFRLADEAGVLRDPALAASRMRTFLAVNGCDG